MPYSTRTNAVLLCMIITGAVRTVAVKLLYQIGLQSPYFVTLLYLLGQSLSLVVDFCGRKLGWIHEEEVGHDLDLVGDHQMANGKINGACSDDGALMTKKEYVAVVPEEPTNDIGHDTNIQDPETPGECSSTSNSTNSSSNSEVDCEKGSGDGKEDAFVDSPPQSVVATRSRSGSETGLTEESSAAVAYIHSIPHTFKPAIPGLFNLINSAMKWSSLIYVPASTAEMLMSGLELILSTVAARIIRKRLISNQRWGGVIVVAIGLIVVRLGDVAPSNIADAFDKNGATDDENAIDNNVNSTYIAAEPSSDRADRLIGDVLIIGQCVMSVLQDMAEELFMHESNLSPTLLLGWEGIFGLTFGVILYPFLAPLIGEDPSDTWAEVWSSVFTSAYVVALVLIFTCTGIFNIVATALTSSMTRNVWKNFRSAVVWAFGLLLFYVSGNDELGEGWNWPYSLVTFGGFIVMIAGVCLYYLTQEAIERSITWLCCCCRWRSITYRRVSIDCDEPGDKASIMELPKTEITR